MTSHSPAAILEAGVAAGAFPGAVVHLARGDAVYETAVGHLGVESPFLRPTNLQTRYDLASLTKIYTLAAAFQGLRAAKIDRNNALNRFLTQFDAQITLEQLMSHRSGLTFPIQRLENVAADEWIRRIAAVPHQNAPGETVHYSCTNFFLLARVIERISGASLDELMETYILRPLQLENTSFAPKNLENVAPTERRDDETGFYHGEVHDEAARSWRAQTGTCAGNAGLFATAADVAAFARVWFDGELLHPADVEAAFELRWREKTYWRGLGWQLDAAFTMSDAAPEGTAGHLGFTGPSLIVERASQRVAVILSNRVHPTRFGPDRLKYHREIARWVFES